MKEIEMKILEVPQKIFLAGMKRLRAKKKYSALVKVKYFDYPDGRIRRRKDLLRVRELTFAPSKKKKTEVVYKIFKGIKNGCKIFDEIEFELDGKGCFDLMSEFLAALGFEQTLFYEKKRTVFVYKNLKFEFDVYPKIPSFLEIEAKSADEIHKIIKKLGLEKYEKTPETIAQLFERKYPKIKLNGLVFRG